MEDGGEMTHKEYMNFLKKYDPITYSELTSDPTNASSDGGCLTVILLFVVAVLGFGVVSAFLI